MTINAIALAWTLNLMDQFDFMIFVKMPLIGAQKVRGWSNSPECLKLPQPYFACIFHS